jgi:hypothetical protein
MTDRTLVEIGDGANLNERCVLQAHWRRISGISAAT